MERAEQLIDNIEVQMRVAAALWHQNAPVGINDREFRLDDAKARTLLHALRKKYTMFSGRDNVER